MEQPAKTRRIDRLSQRRSQEEQNLFARMPAAYSASRQQGQRLLQASAGLSIVEWRVLWDLVEAGPLTIREMAMLQRVDHSQLSRALPAMRDKGFVEMQQDDGDGRKVVVEISPKGRDAYHTADPTMQRRRNALRDAFSETEIQTFAGLLDRFEEFCRQPIENITQPESMK